MRGLSLWQPWASAIACGAKRVETRSWATKYRGLVAIHAGKATGPAMLTAELYQRRQLKLSLPDPLPRGVVVCVVEVVGCEVMNSALIVDESAQELALGDWAEGRYAWRLGEVYTLSEPYPLLGRQGLWRLSEGEADAIRLLAGLPITPRPVNDRGYYEDRGQ